MFEEDKIISGANAMNIITYKTKLREILTVTNMIAIMMGGSTKAKNCFC